LGIYGVPLSVFCGVLGCQPQAGEGYTGEPLFSLQGQVVLREADVGDVVPALMFVFGREARFVDAEVRGDFPASFRLDVMEPPPSSAFIPKDVFNVPGMKGEGAVARIAVVPREHPPNVPQTLFDGSGECNDDGTVCTHQEEGCAEDGRCLERTLECIEEQCPVIASTDPTAVKEFSWTETHSAECIGEACLSVRQFCRPGNDCEREVRKCDLTRTSKTTRIWSRGTYQHCTVIAQSGDPSVAAYENMDFALGYWVNYTTEANEVPGFGTYEPGYHLVEEVQPSDEDWVARLHCEYEAEITALDAYNRAHGTSHTVPYPVGGDEHVEDAVEPEIERLRAACPTLVRTRHVENPLERELTLRLGRSSGGS
jgi:hypothetical protein